MFLPLSYLAYILGQKGLKAWFSLITLDYQNSEHTGYLSQLVFRCGFLHRKRTSPNLSDLYSSLGALKIFLTPFLMLSPNTKLMSTPKTMKTIEKAHTVTMNIGKIP